MPAAIDKTTVQEFCALADEHSVRVLEQDNALRLATVEVGGKTVVVSFAALSIALIRPIPSAIETRTPSPCA